MALTEAAIQAIKPPAPGDERSEIPDGIVSGLYLRPGRRHKSWVYRYRNPNGVHRKMTLGRYATPEIGSTDPTSLNNQQLEELAQHRRLGLAEAREIARLYARRVAQDCPSSYNLEQSTA